MDAAADLLVGARCPGCGRPGLGCCPGCEAELAAGRLHRWRPLHGLSPLAVHAAGVYQGTTRELVTAYKERQAWWLAPALGRRLGLAVAAALDASGWAGPVLLVPVPSTPAAVRARGLDTTARLGVEAARWLRRQGLDVRTGRRLVHRRRVADQAGLGAVERRANLAGALTTRRAALAGEAWLLVDDVVSTGASLAEAARASALAGAVRAGAAVVAASQGRAQVGGQ
ncbi:ComF family protein [Auraticoccus sp. F435]|uniref:ComF family protein n=1 Tax=Auraticoccus cholistanensis TaxID=2656650 RepID=A0A6A9UXG8_9ACTN|nr:ComF family protein [Auraticoccus cholistanensis]